MTERPDIAVTLMGVAELMARRSTCERRRVGAVIARDGRVLSTGFNGAPSGTPHCVHEDALPCKTAVHAEANALIFAARHGVSVDGASMYSTVAPCRHCAGLMINAGIVELVTRKLYSSMTGHDLLVKASIDVQVLGYSPGAQWDSRDSG